LHQETSFPKVTEENSGPKRKPASHPGKTGRLNFLWTLEKRGNSWTYVEDYENK
jgi:hypothetical protein